MIITSLTSVAVSFRSASPATGSPTPTPAVSATDVSTTTPSVPTDTVDGELTSALPKPSQRPARRQPQSGQETAPSTSTDTPSVAGSAVVSVAIQQYTFVEGSKPRGTGPARVAKV